MASVPRLVGEWTKDKLKILELYLPVYLAATTTAIDRIYIDAFAGPGKNLIRRSREEVDGSPLIALKASAKNGNRFTKLYLIEQDERAKDELAGHLRALDANNRCELIYGDVNVELPRLMKRINQRAPAFVFLDTAGIQPRWSTIQAIAPWQVEFLINFPLGMSINRNPDSQRTLEYFGTDEYRTLLRSRGEGKARALLDLYKKRLESLGFAYTTQDDRLVKTANGKRLYYLIFVGKHPAGERIMNAVFSQPDSRGQGRLEL